MKNLIQFNKPLLWCFFLFFCSKAITQETYRVLDVSEKMLSSSIKIEALRDSSINGKKAIFSKTGTGFFFSLYDTIKGTIPLIVTAKHTIQGAKTGYLIFNSSINGKPNYGDKIRIALKNFEKLWISHPTEDIAVLPLLPILEYIYTKKSKIPFFVSWDSTQLLRKGEDAKLSALEDVYMIGYPKGFYDSTNNVPIFRKGITASPVYLDFNEKKQFLVDVPIFSGSSGSPIFLYNQSGYADKKGSFIVGEMRLYLLGIAVESREFEERNDIKTNGTQLEYKTKIPLGIAIVVKATILLDFKPLIEKAFEDIKYVKYFDDI